MGLEGIPDWEASLKIWKVVPPILLIFGTFGNILSITVLMQRKTRRSSTAMYLTALACADLLVLYTGLLRQWIKYMYDFDVRHISVAGCKVHTYLVYVGTHVSSWILVAVTSERLVGVWCPHKVKIGCTATTAGYVIGIICFIMASLNVHWLYGYGDYVYTSENKTELEKCTNSFDDYHHFKEYHWPWIDLSVFCLVPFVILVVENSAIVIKVAKSHAKSRTQVAPVTNDSKQNRPSGKRSQLTAMLLTVNTVFLICVAPITIYLIGQTFWKEELETLEQEAHMELWWAIVNTLMYTNHTLNFALYFLSGSRFRQEVKALFCGGGTQGLFGVTTNKTQATSNTGTSNGDRSIQKKSAQGSLESDKAPDRTQQIETVA